MHNLFEKKETRRQRGQMTVEYSVMFVIIVAVILAAGTQFIKPALNRFFISTANIIDNSTRAIENNF